MFQSLLLLCTATVFAKCRRFMPLGWLEQTDDTDNTSTVEKTDNTSTAENQVFTDDVDDFSSQIESVEFPFNGATHCLSKSLDITVAKLKGMIFDKTVHHLNKQRLHATSIGHCVDLSDYNSDDCTLRQLGATGSCATHFSASAVGGLNHEELQKQGKQEILSIRSLFKKRNFHLDRALMHLNIANNARDEHRKIAEAWRGDDPATKAKRALLLG